MAHNLTNWAYKQNLPSPAKFVLVALCDLANQNGDCCPSIPDLAAMTGLTTRSVINQTNKLVDEGFIHRTKRRREDGYQASNGYKILSEAGAVYEL